MKSHHRSQIAVLMAIVAIANGCAVTHEDWRQRGSANEVAVYFRAHPNADLPEFKAEVTINTSLSEVMMLLTNFSRYPEWVYQCESIAIINAASYTDAYLYQVNSLPIISDRDMIIHGVVNSDDDGNQVSIELQSAPDYCADKTSSLCAQANDSTRVRVVDSQGEITVTKISPQQTQVTWVQYVDPAGLVPNWVTRLMLKQVPLQSLQALKTLAEKPDSDS